MIGKNTSALGFIDLNAFSYCSVLLSLYILGASIYSLKNINVFANTPISNMTTYTDGINGSIFVRESLYNSYITSTNWVTYSLRFVSLTDAQIQLMDGS